jgi:hypothetical protein
MALLNISPRRRRGTHKYAEEDFKVRHYRAPEEFGDFDMYNTWTDQAAETSKLGLEQCLDKMTESLKS